MTRVLKKIGKALLILMVAAFVVYGVATFIMGRKLEAKLNALKAAGKPISVADLKPNIPDSENAAVVYEQVFKLMDKPGVGKDVETIAFFRSGDNDAQVKDVEKAISRNRNIMELTEQAISRPHCRFRFSMHDEAPWNQIIPHLAYIRSLARLYSTDAVLKAEKGDMDGARRSLETGIRIADSLSEEPGILPMLVRDAVIAIVAKGTRETVEHGTVNMKQAKQLQEMFSDIDFKNNFISAMDGERAIFISSSGKLMAHAPRGLMLYPNQLGAISGIDKVIKAADYPYRIVKQQRMLPEKQGYLCVAANMLTSMYNDALKGRDRAVADVNATEVFVALAAYRSKFGHYPAGLKELRAKTVLAVPEDPFSGKDFVYKRKGDGFSFYSIGYNLKDDGGRARIRGKSSPDDLYDIVWKVD